MRNWAGNHEYRAQRVHRPESVEQVQELVRALPRVRALGTRHSFNDIADTSGDLVSLERLERAIVVDPDRPTIHVDGGIRYGDLCEPLDEAGFALHNLASLPHISVAGACATATHGSGVRSGNLATVVAAIELVTGNGEIVRLTREDDATGFAGAVVGLGGLGIVTALDLDVEPAYRMGQVVHEDVPFAGLEDHFAEAAGAADSVSFFTTWRRPAFDQVWLKHRMATDAPGDVPVGASLGGRLADKQLHPIRGLPPDDCTRQLGVPGAWYDRLPHFRMGHTPSAGDEIQSEYFVPLERAAEAIRAVYGVREQVAPLVQVSEIRTIAADELWLSPAWRRPSASIHFTWRPDGPAVAAAMPLLEAVLAPFDPRPHWGKLFTIPPDEVRARYPRLARFRDLARRLDPERKFRNAFLDAYVGD